MFWAWVWCIWKSVILLIVAWHVREIYMEIGLLAELTSLQVNHITDETYSGYSRCWKCSLLLLSSLSTEECSRLAPTSSSFSLVLVQKIVEHLLCSKLCNLVSCNTLKPHVAITSAIVFDIWDKQLFTLLFYILWWKYKNYVSFKVSA
jgi:hypothetical protein